MAEYLDLLLFVVDDDYPEHAGCMFVGSRADRLRALRALNEQYGYRKPRIFNEIETPFSPFPYFLLLEAVVPHRGRA